MTDDLVREINKVLHMMRFLSEGRAGASPDAVRTQPSEPDYSPRMAGESLYEQYAGEMGELRRLLYKMQHDLQRARFSPGQKEIKEERNQRIVRDYEGWPAAKVAVWEDLSISTIRDIRQREGRTQMYGTRVEGQKAA